MHTILKTKTTNRSRRDKVFMLCAKKSDSAFTTIKITKSDVDFQNCLLCSYEIVDYFCIDSNKTTNIGNCVK